MKRKRLDLAATLLLACPALAAAQVQWPGLRHYGIKTGDITVVTPVTGVSTAQETYDVYAPFDGRVEELQAELFRFVTPKSVLARMVSTEMAALLDSSTGDERKQTERRWQDVYSYTEIKPETDGVITNVYIEPGTRVAKGDRLFTVAKKVIIIGKNTEPLYSELGEDMKAEMTHVRTGRKFATKLVNFLKVKGADRVNRLWLEVQDLKDGIKIGEQFEGTLFVGENKNAMLVPRGRLIEAEGKTFLITEVKTGLQTREEVELVGHSSEYLEPPALKEKDGKDGGKDGKDKKSR
ncbi:MAG: hypothetical protein M0025_12720 [Elusimicrobia bacterium]|nr:hypothetical protein [Elusimicrobiota bacterium]